MKKPSAEGFFGINAIDSLVAGSAWGIGEGAFTGAGQLRFDKEILSGNINGNLAADFEIHLVGVSNDQFNGSYLA